MIRKQKVVPAAAAAANPIWAAELNGISVIVYYLPWLPYQYIQLKFGFQYHQHQIRMICPSNLYFISYYIYIYSTLEFVLCVSVYPS